MNNLTDEVEASFLISYRNEPSGSIIQKIDFRFPAAQEIIDAENEFSVFIDDILTFYYNAAVEFINNSIDQKKRRNKLISFNDLIKILQDNIHGITFDIGISV